MAPTLTGLPGPPLPASMRSRSRSSSASSNVVPRPGGPLPAAAVQQQQQQPPQYGDSGEGGLRRGRTRTLSVSGSMSVPQFLRPSGSPLRARLSRWAGQHLNFYRVHVLYFVFTPLIVSGIFYAANENVQVAYIDCLFVCVSAMTVTGLTTINISTATTFQQFLLFVLMCIGNLSAVSATMVWTRRRFFRRKFEDVVARSSRARKRMRDVEDAERRAGGTMYKVKRMFHKHDDDSGEPSLGGSSGSTDEHMPSGATSPRKAHAAHKHSAKRKGPLTLDMIRRVDEPAVLVNPMGMPSIAHHDSREANRENGGEPPVSPTAASAEDSAPRGILSSSGAEDSPSNANVGSIRIAEPTRFLRGPIIVESPAEIENREAAENGSAVSDHDGQTLPPLSAGRRTFALGDSGPSTGDGLRTRFDDSALSRRRLSDPPAHVGSHMRRGSDGALAAAARGLRPPAPDFPRSQTVEFADPPRASRPPTGPERAATTAFMPNTQGLRYRGTGLEFERTQTMYTNRSYGRRSSVGGSALARVPTTSKERGFGGFPTPIEIAGSLIKRVAPSVQRTMTRSVTMPRTSTIASVQSGGGATDNGVRSAPYLSFDVTVSRNSRFHELSEAQREELGGVEYRAIDMLCWLIPAYWLLMNFFFIVLVAPWLATPSAAQKFYAVRETQAPHQPNSTWFWFFQVVSAYTNTGLSLIDTSMISLADQYFMLIPIGTLILAGNTAFPIILRFFIWSLSKAVPRGGRSYETLHFLLDHPRRCFVYLFPSAQTWFLLFVLVVLNCTDWVAFLVLDITNPVIQAIPTGQRVFDGLFQSIAVRAAGFQVVSLLSLAPAVQYLYVIMMYISAYPIAMSVRNTNVYEERALGIYDEDPDDEEDDTPTRGGAKIWGTYLAAHARRQLAFDIWWLGFALWLITIIEKNNIEDPATNGWFTIFSCLFELTSAYGTVGLSTGTPTDNFSLSGRFSTLSKLVVICVMLRGRHRGLPVAIDRAVLLPSELEIEDAGREGTTTGDEELLASTGYGTNSIRASTGTGMPLTRTSTGGALRFNEKDDGEAMQSAAYLDSNGYGQGLAPIKETTPAGTPAGTGSAAGQQLDFSQQQQSDTGMQMPRSNSPESITGESSSASGHSSAPKSNGAGDVEVPHLDAGSTALDPSNPSHSSHSDESGPSQPSAAAAQASAPEGSASSHAAQ